MKVFDVLKPSEFVIECRLDEFEVELSKVMRGEGPHGDPEKFFAFTVPAPNMVRIALDVLREITGARALTWLRSWPRASEGVSPTPWP